VQELEFYVSFSIVSYANDFKDALLHGGFRASSRSDMNARIF
jgi:hypothetical protein